MIKRNFFLLLLLVISLATHAQVSKGTFQVGVTASPLYYKIHDPDYKSSGYVGNINLSYFLRKNISVGIMPYYSSQLFYDELYYPDLIQKDFGMNAFARFYYVRNKISVFGQLGLGIGKSLDFYKHPPVGMNKKYSDLKGPNLLLGLGLNYQLNNKVSLEVALYGLDMINYKGTSFGHPYTGYKNSFGLYPSFGVNLCLNSNE